MIPEIGLFAVVLALVVAFVQSIVPIVGAHRQNYAWIAVARPATYVHFVLVTISIICLGIAFAQDDFTVQYVATHSNSELPMGYKISAIWGGHEGSFLLWIFFHAGWAAAVAFYSRKLPEDAMARVLGVMGIISIGLIAFLVFTSNPFDRLLPNFPIDGKDLNPQLQDIGFKVHPPMLFMGYVGFAVAFSFAIAALISGELDSAWARWSRPWTTIAWVFLTLGIALGSWWAYYELGWGGWWFWDPVENASFMPWLVGTALMHSLAVTDKRGLFKAWTVLLAITAFSLSLLGTFLVRSGILVSVHAFAADPDRGLFILGFLGVVVGGSFLLFAYRAGTVESQGDFKWFSREIFLLFNNVFLCVATFMVLVGTLYPVLVEQSVSIGAPFFNLYFGLLMTPLLVALAIGPLIKWRYHEPGGLLKDIWIVLGICLVLAIVVPLVLADEQFVYVNLALFLALWIALVSGKDLWKKVSHRQSPLASLKKLSRSYYGMLTAHIGVAFCVIGTVMTTAFSIEKDVRLEPGQSATVAGYDFRLNAIDTKIGPNYVADKATFDIFRGKDFVTQLFPEKRRYNASGTITTEVDIDVAFLRDIYVAMGEPLEGGQAWAVRLYYKPFIRWIWLGAILMGLGGILSVSDKRYRIKLGNKLRGEAASDAA